MNTDNLLLALTDDAITSHQELIELQQKNIELQLENEQLRARLNHKPTLAVVRDIRGSR